MRKNVLKVEKRWITSTETLENWRERESPIFSVSRVIRIEYTFYVLVILDKTFSSSMLAYIIKQLIINIFGIGSSFLKA
jgi:hypothetical protein